MWEYESIQTVYVVTLANTKHYGIQVKSFKSISELLGKLLYHWNSEIVYRCLSVKEIENGINNADILNNIAEQKYIDDLISEALLLDILKKLQLWYLYVCRQYALEIRNKSNKPLSTSQT